MRNLLLLLKQFLYQTALCLVRVVFRLDPSFSEGMWRRNETALSKWNSSIAARQAYPSFESLLCPFFLHYGQIFGIISLTRNVLTPINRFTDIFFVTTNFKPLTHFDTKNIKNPKNVQEKFIGKHNGTHENI